MQLVVVVVAVVVRCFVDHWRQFWVESAVRTRNIFIPTVWALEGCPFLKRNRSMP